MPSPPGPLHFFPLPCFSKLAAASLAMGAQPPWRQRLSPSPWQSGRHSWQAQAAQAPLFAVEPSMVILHFLQIPQRCNYGTQALQTDLPPVQTKSGEQDSNPAAHLGDQLSSSAQLLCGLRGGRRWPAPGHRRSALPGTSDNGPGQCLRPLTVKVMSEAFGDGHSHAHLGPGPGAPAPGLLSPAMHTLAALCQGPTLPVSGPSHPPEHETSDSRGCTPPTGIPTPLALCLAPIHPPSQQYVGMY